MTDIVYAMILFKEWDQVRRLIARLDGPNVHFVIHVDRKAAPGFVSSAVAYLAGRPNCHFVRRESVYWGAWGLVQALLNGARYVEDQSIPCDFYIYMSGQDYPLSSPAEIDAFFAEHKGSQFLENFRLPYEHWAHGGMDRVKSFHFQVRGRHLSYPPAAERVPTRLRPLVERLPMIDRVLPGGYEYYGGSAAIILARNGIAYLNAFVASPLGRRMIRHLKRARHPDEIFFQTVFLNSELRETVVNDELRYVDWAPPVGLPPKILGMEDYERLRA